MGRTAYLSSSVPSGNPKSSEGPRIPVGQGHENGSLPKKHASHTVNKEDLEREGADAVLVSRLMAFRRKISFATQPERDQDPNFS